MVTVLKELWEFMKTNKKLWLAPLLVVLGLVAVLVVLAQNTAIAPFIYTLF